MTSSAADHEFMARALTLAARGCYQARPNPMVGCVLVRDGNIIGEGWHERCGEAHAEVNALQQCDDASGATAYVTLEPCAHHGKTPPCADALINAGIAEVVIALEDPFAEVAGRGVARLEQAGVPVRIGLKQAESERLLRGYLSRIRKQRPFVTLKLGVSLDGAIAMQSGESQWITGADARADVQRLRARSGAILSGIGTVLADDPSFNVRDENLAERIQQPLRALVDSELRLPTTARLLQLAGSTVVYCRADAAPDALQQAGAEIVTMPGVPRSVDLFGVLTDLAARHVNDVLVEAGPKLSGALLQAALVDELVIYQAPHLLGSETRTMLQTPAWTRLADRCELNITDLRRVGNDLRITASVAD